MPQEAGSNGIRVLHPTEIALRVRELVGAAQEILIVITPYFKPWTQMQAEIERAVKRDVDVRLIVREDEVSKMHDALAPCFAARIKVLSRTRLHAKLYVTESAAILTSMNLLEASANDSWEAGIQVEKAGAPDAYRRLLRQAQDLIEASDEIASPERTRAKKAASAKAELGPPSLLPPSKGSCLRCGEKIRFDPEKPLCFECYGSWKKYANADYAEKHCHGCGALHATSVAKPLCRPCWTTASKAGVV